MRRWMLIGVIALGLGGTVVIGPAQSIAAASQTSLTKVATPNIPCQITWGNNCTSLRDLLQSIAEFLLAIAGTLFFFMFLYGGIQYLSGAGNEDQTAKAKNTMLSAIIGLIIVTSAWAILRLVVEGITGG